MTQRSYTVGLVLVMVALTIWGLAGLFIHNLVGYGVGPVQIVYYSSALNLLLLGGGLLLFAPRYLFVPLRVLPELLVVAFLSTGLAFIMYTTAIDLVGVSMGILLNYTAPVWVTLLAWRVLGEPVGLRRVIALGGAFIGCALLVRVYDSAAISVSALGIAAGLGSGVAWAGYQVFGKRMLQTLHPFTLSVYGSFTATLVLLPFQAQPLPLEVPAAAWPWLLVFVVAANLIGPIAFNSGLQVLQAGLVSLLAIWEIVIGVAIGVMLLGEVIEPYQAIGGLLVVASVYALRPSAPPDPCGPSGPMPIPADA